MIKNPLVSFVVTSYNYAKYIERTLDSIKGQTYNNFEIIIVDDASDDNSAEIIERYIEQNQQLRITFINHKENIGQLGSMIDGLKIAQGVFVSFIDSDDVLMKNYAEIHTKVHLSTSVAFTSSQVLEIDENDELHTAYSIASPHSEESKRVVSVDEILNTDINQVRFKEVKNKRFGGWYWSPNSSAMYRKSALDIVAAYKNPQNWRVCPDKFLFNLMQVIGGSINIELPLVAYRRHMSNAGNSAYISGDKKYHTDKNTYMNLKNNIKIRPLTLDFIWSVRKQIQAKFGTRGLIKMLFKVSVL